MVTEVLELLAPSRGGLFVDCTVGLGGHARALLEARRHAPARARSRRCGAGAGARSARAVRRSRRARARRLPRARSRARRTRHRRHVDGALADLGVSSMQLDADGRGFSFRRDEPLDMRMDQSRGPTRGRAAARRRRDGARRRDLPVRRGAAFAPRRARDRRRRGGDAPIETTGRLAAIVRRAVPHRGHQRIDPATRTFQALRIWVNRELDGLDAFLAAAARRLLADARLAVITFHSLEDRIVKHTFRAHGEGRRRACAS